MSMTNWAEREIAAACKRENPDWDGKSFDYGCGCYQSALKAYKSLMGDDHSGMSFGFARAILVKLLYEIPLSPITDEDFFSVERGTDEHPGESSEWLKSRNLKSDLQCPRRSSLFRQEDLDGNVTYHDLDRSCCVNAECPSDTHSGAADRIIDELYPITMPYTPRKEMYRVYTKSWLTDKRHGDFDVDLVIGFEDLDGVWHDYLRCVYYGDNGKEITNDPMRIAELANKRLYPAENSVAARIAAHIVNDVVDSYAENATEEKRAEIRNLCNKCADGWLEHLKGLCKCLAVEDEHGVCRKNTWSNQRAIATGSEEDRARLVAEIPGVEYLIEAVDDMKAEFDAMTAE